MGVDVSTPGGTLPAQACTPWVIIAKTCWYSGCVSVHWLWPILCTISNSQFRALNFCTSQYYRSWLFTAGWQSVDTVGPGRIWQHLKIYIGWSMNQAIWFYHQAGHFTYSVFPPLALAGASFNLEMMQHLFPQLRIIEMAKAFHLWGLAGGTSSSILRRSPNSWQWISVALSPWWRFLERLWY